jgi:uncharacterized coiled-coil protein SlyX
MTQIAETYDTLIHNINVNVNDLKTIEYKISFNNIDRREFRQLIGKIKDNNEKFRDNIIVLKYLTEKQTKELNEKIRELEQDVENLENQNKTFTERIDKLEKDNIELKKDNIELKKDNIELKNTLHSDQMKKIDKELTDDIRISLSDIYYNKNQEISNMFKLMILNNEYKKNNIIHIDTLNKIINTYKDWLKFKEHKNVDSMTNIQQFKTIVIPNLKKWNLDLDIYLCLNRIYKIPFARQRDEQNKIYHKNPNIIKQILNNVSNMSEIQIKQLDIDDDLPKYLNAIIKLIE